MGPCQDKTVRDDRTRDRGIRTWCILTLLGYDTLLDGGWLVPVLHLNERNETTQRLQSRNMIDAASKSEEATHAFIGRAVAATSSPLKVCPATNLA